jgi:vitamin B12 transporter
MSLPFKPAALAAFLVAAFPVHAENPSDEAAIIVVATRLPTRINTITADVTVIEREQIEQAGPAGSLGDLLTRTPGIEMSRQGSRGTPEGIFIRGANAGHTLILLDGQRVGSATLGQTAIESIPLSQVERIEILRGSASAMYGSDAIGGVIRINTRQASDAPRLDLRVGAGSHGAQETSLAHAGRVGQLDYALRAGDSRASGVNAITNSSSAAFNNDKDGFWRRNLSANAAWRPDDTTDIGGHWFESDGMNRFDASWPTATADWQTRHKVTSYAAHAKFRLAKDWTSELRAGRGEDNSITTPSSTAGQAKDSFLTRQDQFVWQNDIRLPIGQGMAALEDLREEVASTNAFTGTRRSTRSLVLGWNGSIGAHFWQAGLRRDNSSQFGGKTTETLGYGYRFNDVWRASASAGTAFKAPTFNDLYFPNTAFTGVGNASLQPEYGRSQEAAIHYAQGNSNASLTRFRNTIRNLIQWEETAPGSFFYTPRNVGEARIAGWTAVVGTRLAEWSIDAHLTAQDAKDQATGEYLVRRARQFGTLAFGRDSGHWSGGMEVQGSGPRYDAPDFTTRKNTRRLSGYSLVNLRGEYRLDTNWALFARVDNLFNAGYELARSSTSQYAFLGTTLFIGARFVLK